MTEREKILIAIRLWAQEELRLLENDEFGRFVSFCERNDLDDGEIHDVLLTAVADLME